MKRFKFLYLVYFLWILLKEFFLSKKLFYGMCSFCCVCFNDCKVKCINIFFDVLVFIIFSIFIIF